MVRSEKTRQLIIEKTAEIFNKKGYTGTHLSDLTAATGLTKGSIYGNFKDKQEVALEAFRHNYKTLVSGFNKRMAKENTATDKLLAFVDFFKKKHKKVFESGGCAVLNTATDVDDTQNREIFREVQKALLNWRQVIEDIIRQGMESGELQSVDATKMANKIIALIEGSILMSKTLKDSKILIENLDSLADEILQIKKQ